MSADTPRKAILITGAASGIGRATARLFAEGGWFVGCFDRNEAELASLQAEIGAANGIFRRLDVTDHDDFRVARDAFGAASGGRMDVLHNNAGINAEGAFGDMPWQTVMAIVNVNLIGVLFGIHTALPLLKATPGSLCFTTSSSSAILGMGGIAAYSATKQAVRGLTEALSIELRASGVRAADALPGLIDTGMVAPERKPTSRQRACSAWYRPRRWRRSSGKPIIATRSTGMCRPSLRSSTSRRRRPPSRNATSGPGWRSSAADHRRRSGAFQREIVKPWR